MVTPSEVRKMVRFVERYAAWGVLVVWVLLLGVGVAPSSGESTVTSAGIGVDIAELGPGIDHPLVAFGSLKRAVFTGKDRDPDSGTTSKVRMEMSVRETTVVIAGVKATVVDVSDWQDGELVEKTRDYYAQHRSGAVYYLGEHVDDISDGKVVGHEGEWVAGENKALAGIYMPATPKAGDVFEQERAPGVAQDRSKVIAVGRTVKVPAGTFTNCIETEDYDPIGKSTQRKW